MADGPEDGLSRQARRAARRRDAEPQTRIVDRRAEKRLGRDQAGDRALARRGTHLALESEVEAASSREPRDPRDVRELAVLVCIGCWRGTLPWPPYERGKGDLLVKNRDVGIDLWYDTRPVVKNHRCSGAQYRELEDTRAQADTLLASFPAGNWKTEVLDLPTPMYDQLIRWGGVKPGRPITDPRTKMNRGRTRRS